jgi:DNA-binding transcriptional MerR regulator
MGDDKRFSLGELAAAAGMTTRNVRAYQTRGLIPPPLRVGRRSEYTSGHLERLRAISRARAHGATLGLIAEYLSHGGAIDLTRFTDGWLPEQRPAREPRRSDLSSLLSRARVADDRRVRSIVEDLISAGVVARDGRRIVAGQELVSTITALHRHGLPGDIALTVALRAAESAAALSGRLAQLLAAGQPAVLDHVAELASGVLRAVLLGGLARQPDATRP